MTNKIVENLTSNKPVKNVSKKEEKLPSVSKIINPISYMGLVDVNKELINNSANRGNRVHEWIQAKLQQKPLPSLEEQDLPFIKAMNQLMRENPEHAKNLLGSKCEVPFENEGSYQGRVDFYNEKEGVLYELKTTASVSLTHKLQLLAYNASFKGLKASYLISLKKDGSYKIYNLNDWKIFYLAEIWNRLIELYYLGCERGGSSLKNMFTKKLPKE